MAGILTLFRPKISMMVGLSAFAGACLFTSNVNLSHIFAALSALFLSAGTSSINQFQERKQDSMMNRTAYRPLVTGAASSLEALSYGVVLIILSALSIYLAGGVHAFVFIPATILIYNLIYTPMKLKTPFALLVGSLTGSLPPLMGYTASGGTFTNPEILIITTALFLWQTPHFALLAEKYKEDYASAGFKTISKIYGDRKAKTFIYVWLTAFICVLIFIPTTNIYTTYYTKIAHMAALSIISISFIVYRNSHRTTFHFLNLSLVLFFVMLVVDRIII